MALLSQNECKVSSPVDLSGIQGLTLNKESVSATGRHLGNYQQGTGWRNVEGLFLVFETRKRPEQVM
jgi:hypothetical protein